MTATSAIKKRPVRGASTELESALALRLYIVGDASLSAELDFDINASGEVEFHQGINGLRCRVDDVEHALMCADFKLFARLLVDVGRAVDGELLDAGRQRDGSADRGAGALGCRDDLASRFIEDTVVE